MIILELAESFKTMNRPDHDALWRLISRKILKIGTWNFGTILIVSKFVLFVSHASYSSTVARNKNIFYIEGRKPIEIFLSPIYHSITVAKN